MKVIHMPDGTVKPVDEPRPAPNQYPDGYGGLPSSDYRTLFVSDGKTTWHTSLSVALWYATGIVTGFILTIAYISLR